MSKLIPENLMAEMIMNHYDVQAGRSEDHPPVIKLFCANATWLISEVDPFYDNDIAFGLCDLGFGTPELGSLSISELEQAVHPRTGLKVERDLHFTPTHPMSVYAKAARMCQRITEDPAELAEAVAVLKQRENKL
jgi:hypothetical protein